MKNFNFINPTKIIFGENVINNLTDEIKQYKKILITYGGGSIKKNGVYDVVVKNLKDFDLVEFSGIEPNPSVETMEKCRELILKEKPDFILAVGGGSVVDASKFIAKACFHKGALWDIPTGKAKAPEISIPLGCILTLPATGSESNTGAVISKRETSEKLGFLGCDFPIFAIMDPTYTMSLPMKQVANGVADTFVHIMEQYVTFEQNSPIQDGFCETLLKTLLQETPKVIQNPNNYEIRANLMWAATLGLNGLIGVGVEQDWATHMIGHEITALYGLDHGVTLSIIMPSLFEVMLKEKQDKLLQFGKNVLGLNLDNNEKSAKIVIDKIREFFESLPIKTHFKDYNINEDCINKIINNLKKHNILAFGEMGIITLDKVEKILKLSL